MQTPTPQEDELHPDVLAVLAALWRQYREGAPRSLAALSKGAGLPMSSLRRLLGALQAAGLITPAPDARATGAVQLSEEGAALCRTLFTTDA